MYWKNNLRLNFCDKSEAKTQAGREKWVAYHQNREFTKTQFTRIKPHMQSFFPWREGECRCVQRVHTYIYIYVCFAQYENLRNFEIALRALSES